MATVTFEIAFRRHCTIRNLIELLQEKARTLSVASIRETSQGIACSINHKKHSGTIRLSESRDGICTGSLIEGDRILGALVDWIGRNGQDLVHRLDIRFPAGTTSAAGRNCRAMR